MQLSKRDYFFSQPHQPFFALGMLNAIVFMLLFVLIYKGLIGADAIFVHVYSMIFLVFTNFFYGFLYTTFPRFSGTEPVEVRKYLFVFSLQLLATITFLIGVWWSITWYIAALLVAIGFARTLHIFYGMYKRTLLPKRDLYWIIVALGIGAISNILFILSLIPCSCQSSIFFDTAVGFGVYLYMIFLAFVIGLRMVPFFSHIMAWKHNKFLHLEIFLLFLLHSFLATSFKEALFIVDFIAGVLIIQELRNIQLPFPNREPLLWILHISLFWLGGGLLLGAIIEAFEAFRIWDSLQLPLHLLVLGFLTTILIGFGTRVMLGHSGRALQADKVTVWIFYFTQIVVLGRIIFSLAAAFGTISPFFDISATLWLILFTWWMGKYFGVLIKKKTSY